mmetsp:Transcript_30472/g.84060  ORF Transcript_30472/g.84060 Transcript_30472/m.84060 type:complete len:314 (+) Transcript_30472:210-1151(+)
MHDLGALQTAPWWPGKLEASHVPPPVRYRLNLADEGHVQRLLVASESVQLHRPVLARPGEVCRPPLLQVEKDNARVPLRRIRAPAHTRSLVEQAGPDLPCFREHGGNVVQAHAVQGCHVCPDNGVGVKPECSRCAGQVLVEVVPGKCVWHEQVLPKVLHPSQLDKVHVRWPHLMQHDRRQGPCLRSAAGEALEQPLGVGHVGLGYDQMDHALLGPAEVPAKRGHGEEHALHLRGIRRVDYMDGIQTTLWIILWLECHLRAVAPEVPLEEVDVGPRVEEVLSEARGPRRSLASGRLGRLRRFVGAARWRQRCNP